MSSVFTGRCNLFTDDSCSFDFGLSGLVSKVSGSFLEEPSKTKFVDGTNLTETSELSWLRKR